MRISQEKRREYILNAPVLTTMILISIPTFMLAIVQALVPFTDGLFLNNLIGPERAGAISYSQPAINMIIGVSQGLGVAGTAMIGQMAGRGDTKKIKEISLQILVFSICFGVMIMPINFLIARYMSNTVESVMQSDVYYYIFLYSFVIPFQFMAAIFNSIKNATGNPEAPFYRIVVLLLLKVFFNYMYLYVFSLGFYGAVFASFCAYFFTALWMYYDLFLANHLYKLDIKEYKFNKSIIKTLIKIAIPSMLNFMMINLGFLLINLEISKYGRTVISAMGIAGNINNLSFQLPASIGTTVTTMISINMGVNNIKKCKKILKIASIISLIISISTVLIIIPASHSITRLFTNKENILSIANVALEIATYSIIPYGLFMIFQSVYQAMGKNIIPLIMSFLRIWLFRYAFILITQSYLSYYSVFYGNLFSNILALIIFVIWFTRIKWETGIKYE